MVYVSHVPLLYSMARSYRRNFIETQGGNLKQSELRVDFSAFWIFPGDVKNVFNKLVFCSWDFSITQEKSLRLQTESISNQIKVIGIAMHKKLTHIVI